MFFRSIVKHRIQPAIVGGWVAAALTLSCSMLNAEEKITWQEHAKPVLQRRCAMCHNGNRQEGGLDVSGYSGLMQGGGSGEVISAGSADDSYLFRLVTHDESPEMPPSGTKIPDAEIELLRKWIDGGALKSKDSTAKKSPPKPDLTKIAGAAARPTTIPNPARLSLQPVLTTARASMVHDIAASPWSTIVAATSPQQIILTDAQTLELVGVIPFSEGQPESLSFSNDNRLLLIAGGRPADQGVVVVWDLEAGQRLTTIAGQPDSVMAAGLHPAGQRVAIGGSDRTVRVLDFEGDEIFTIDKHTDWIQSIAFSPNGKFLASSDRAGGLRISDSETGNEIFTLAGHQDSVNEIAWRIDGRVLASASDDGSVKLWDVQNGKLIRSWNPSKMGLTSIAWTRDGRIVTGGRDKKVELRDQKGKSLQKFSPMADEVISVTFSDDSNRVLAGDWSGNLNVWDAATPAPVGTIDVNPPALAERVADLSQQSADANERLETLQQKVESLRQEHVALQMAVQAEVADSDAIAAELEQLKSDEEEEAENVEQSIAELTAEASVLEKSIAQSQLQIGELNDKISGQQKQIEPLEAEAQRLLAVHKHWHEELKFDRELRDHLASVEAARVEAEKRQAAADAAKQHVTELEQKRSELGR